MTRSLELKCGRAARRNASRCRWSSRASGPNSSPRCRSRGAPPAPSPSGRTPPAESGRTSTTSRLPHPAEPEPRGLPGTSDPGLRAKPWFAERESGLARGPKPRSLPSCTRVRPEGTIRVLARLPGRAPVQPRRRGDALRKDVLVAETAYPFTLGWKDGWPNVNGAPEQLVAGYTRPPVRRQASAICSPSSGQ
jgi:hypothetical protein